MIFDEDSKLFGFTQRYSDDAEEEELKNHIVEYVTQSNNMIKQSQGFPNQEQQQEANQDGFYEVGANSKISHRHQPQFWRDETYGYLPVRVDGLSRRWHDSQ